MLIDRQSIIGCVYHWQIVAASKHHGKIEEKMTLSAFCFHLMLVFLTMQKFCQQYNSCWSQLLFKVIMVEVTFHSIDSINCWFASSEALMVPLKLILSASVQNYSPGVIMVASWWGRFTYLSTSILSGNVIKAICKHVSLKERKIGSAWKTKEYIREQKYFNIALILQDEWLTIFTHPSNTCTCPLKAYAIKNIRE